MPETIYILWYYSADPMLLLLHFGKYFIPCEKVEIALNSLNAAKPVHWS